MLSSKDESPHAISSVSTLPPCADVLMETSNGIDVLAMVHEGARLKH
jgi:hypothetical protein